MIIAPGPDAPLASTAYRGQVGDAEGSERTRSVESFSTRSLAPARPLSALHEPALDGVRGVAILLVMMRHFFVGFENSIAPGMKFDWLVYNLARTGSVGVDLFFVLSGYLITGILIDTRNAPNRFRRFYVRRTLRIFPLYYAFLAFVFFAWPRMNMPSNIGIGKPWGDEIWYWCYGPNILFALRGEWGGLSHFWLLAVEEQFYLVWPLVVFLVPVSRLKAVCVGCVVTAFVLRIACAVAEVSIVVPYVSLFTRMDALAIGAWLAVSAREPGGLAAVVPRAKWMLGLCCVGLLTTLAASFGLGRTLWVNAAGGSLVAIVFGVVVLWSVALPKTNIVPRVFSNPVLMFFGKYAYCLYVVHGPLAGWIEHYVRDDEFVGAVFGSMLPGRMIYVLICTLGSVAIALVSWHVFEKQILKLKDRLS